MIPPRFDRLAPHYRWIETASFGGLLNWCRTALIPEVTDARRVLVLGEGDGRFLAAFLAANAMATVDVIDASPAMVALAQDRIAKLPGAASRVRWTIADARTADAPGASYDLIVTNFFLDCFPVETLDRLVGRLVETLTPNGRWLVGDFAIPSGRTARLAARLALATMYASFQLVTRIPAGRLADPAPILRRHGLALQSERRRLNGFLVAGIWIKGDSPLF